MIYSPIFRTVRYRDTFHSPAPLKYLAISSETDGLIIHFLGGLWYVVRHSTIDLFSAAFKIGRGGCLFINRIYLRLIRVC